MASSYNITADGASIHALTTRSIWNRLLDESQIPADAAQRKALASELNRRIMRHLADITTERMLSQAG